MSQKRRKLLIVDDVDLNRMILNELFCDKFDVLEAENGDVALELIQKYQEEISIVLLDLIMPVMDGFEVLAAMKDLGLSSSIPVIMITGENDDDKLLTGYGLGIADLVNKPFNPEIVVRRVNNVVELYDHQRNLQQKLNEQKEELEKQSQSLRQTNQFVIDALSTTVEYRDIESGEHIKRTRALVGIILKCVQDEYPLSDEDIETIANVSVMHDIGKIAIPDNVLLKPGRLTKEEFEIMKKHTIYGCDILSSLDYTQDIEYFTYGYDICRYHHERWDGSGYPDRLMGEAIPIWAQAAALADVYDALSNKRVYKPAYTHEETMNMILNGECGEFNPKIMAGFMRIRDEIPEMLSKKLIKTPPIIK